MNQGHVEWGSGAGVKTGFTTTAPPNTYCPFTYTDGFTYDIDWANEFEGSSLTAQIFGAITARSYHSGYVNTSFMDGSVRAIANTININVWQALSTRAGAEDSSLFNNSNF